MIRDVTGTFNAWSHNSELLFDIYSQTGNDIPQNSVEITLPKAILGISRALRIKEKFGVMAAVDVDLSFDGKRNVLMKSERISGDPHFGLELDYVKIVYLRFGFGNFQQVKNFDSTLYRTFQPNFGLGVNIKKVMIDYALTDIGNQSDALYSHVFFLKVSLPH